MPICSIFFFRNIRSEFIDPHNNLFAYQNDDLIIFFNFFQEIYYGKKGSKLKVVSSNQQQCSSSIFSCNMSSFGSSRNGPVSFT